MKNLECSATALLRCNAFEVVVEAGSLLRKAALGRHWNAHRSNTSRSSKPHVMQNRFYLVVAGITIRLLVLVTSHTVDFEAGDWRGNCAGHLSLSAG
ncbi:hypothetical protein TNCV_4890871 [Trichonephila clavipes]|nr:hypothetical protein TNCV_4890871 [Trichonephila clavipes]